MPSPIGHSLIGLALGWGALPRVRGGRWGRGAMLAACVVAANLPDLDFLPGLVVGDFNRFHQGPSHSLAFAVLAAIGIGWLGGRRWPGRGRSIGIAVGILICSHLVADIWCEDRSAPYGIPLLWPASEVAVTAPTPVFLAMSKATLAEVFSAGNLPAALRELWVGGLAVLTAGILRPPGRS